MLGVEAVVGVNAFGMNQELGLEVANRIAGRVRSNFFVHFFQIAQRGNEDSTVTMRRLEGFRLVPIPIRAHILDRHGGDGPD